MSSLSVAERTRMSVCVLLWSSVMAPGERTDLKVGPCSFYRSTAWESQKLNFSTRGGGYFIHSNPSPEKNVLE